MIRAVPAVILGSLFALYLFDVMPAVSVYSVSPDLSLNMNLAVAGVVLAITLVRGVLYPLHRYGLGRYEFYENVVRASYGGKEMEVPYSKVTITGNIRGGSKVIGLRISVEGDKKPWNVPNARSKEWGAELVTWLANRLSSHPTSGSNVGGSPAIPTPNLGPWIFPQPGTATSFKCPNCGAPIPVRVGSVVTTCEYCGANLPNPIFESLESTIAQAIAQRMGPMMEVPSHLPPDMTGSQYRVLRMFSQFHGRMKPIVIAKLLKMDKNEFEKDADALRANGYLSNDDSVTKKGLNVLSRP